MIERLEQMRADCDDPVLSAGIEQALRDLNR
jgi:hypothetical protein